MNRPQWAFSAMCWFSQLTNCARLKLTSRKQPLRMPNNSNVWPDCVMEVDISMNRSLKPMATPMVVAFMMKIDWLPKRNDASQGNRQLDTRPDDPTAQSQRLARFNQVHRHALQATSNHLGNIGRPIQHDGHDLRNQFDRDGQAASVPQSFGSGIDTLLSPNGVMMRLASTNTTKVLDTQIRNPLIRSSRLASVRYWRAALFSSGCQWQKAFFEFTQNPFDESPGLGRVTSVKDERQL